MALMTRNEKDFVPLARKWADENRNHSGIIISAPFTKNQFGELVNQTLGLLNKRTADELVNTLVYLSNFADPTAHPPRGTRIVL